MIDAVRGTRATSHLDRARGERLAGPGGQPSASAARQLRRPPGAGVDDLGIGVETFVATRRGPTSSDGIAGQPPFAVVAENAAMRGPRRACEGIRRSWGTWLLGPLSRGRASGLVGLACTYAGETDASRSPDPGHLAGTELAVAGGRGHRDRVPTDGRWREILR